MAEISWSEFKVDLKKLSDAIGSVGNESDLVEGYMTEISRQFAGIKQEWVSPSELSFEDVQQWFVRVQTDLHRLLDETVRRMKIAYDNYHSAEQANTNNLTANVHDGSGHNGSGHNGSGHNGSGHNGSGHNGSGHNGSGHGPEERKYVRREPRQPYAPKPSQLGTPARPSLP